MERDPFNFLVQVFLGELSSIAHFVRFLPPKKLLSFLKKLNDEKCWFSPLWMSRLISFYAWHIWLMQYGSQFSEHWGMQIEIFFCTCVCSVLTGRYETSVGQASLIQVDRPRKAEMWNVLLLWKLLLFSMPSILVGSQFSSQKLWWNFLTQITEWH